MDLKNKIDLLFRREYGQLVSVLSLRFSLRYIDLIEDAVQESMYRAMRLWPYRGLPDNPPAWLYRVAHNELLDRLRRLQRSPEVDYEASSIVDLAASDEGEGIVLGDEQLEMIFACCHPALTTTEQIMLSLKLLCGFGIREIAAALLKKPGAVKRAITRAKHKFRQEVKELSIPVGPALAERLGTVLHVLYLLFNEGYKPVDGDTLIKRHICGEAMRLAGILYRHKHCNISDVRALLALMCFNAARFPARLSPEGQMITLEEQDRRLWDEELIAWGNFFLAKSVDGVYLSRYHIESGIASCHANALTFEQTDWKTILQLYDLLLRSDHSPVVALNRLVAVRHVEGASAALQALDELKGYHDYGDYYLYHAIKAEFLLSSGSNPEEARFHLSEAVRLCSNNIERAFLERKLLHSSEMELHDEPPP